MKRTIALSVILAALVCAAAFGANPMAGAWKASSGYIVSIPDGYASFELMFLGPKGEKNVYKAVWVTRGAKFTWIDAQGSKHTATYEPAKDRIEDVNAAWPDSPAYWYRLAHIPPTPAQSPAKPAKR